MSKPNPNIKLQVNALNIQRLVVILALKHDSNLLVGELKMKNKKYFSALPLMPKCMEFDLWYICVWHWVQVNLVWLLHLWARSKENLKMDVNIATQSKLRDKYPSIVVAE